MKFYNIKYREEIVSFAQAIKQGLGKKQGLFFPIELPRFTTLEINELLKMNFVNRSTQIISSYIGNELFIDQLYACVNRAFLFPAPLVKINNNIFTLELFHGPTLAFKDFGSRFMAQILNAFYQNESMTILTATSGDTGAAVAHAFYGIENINVVILYPKNKISLLQEKLFCTLGKNIKTLAVDGDFDACQNLIKQAFDDEFIRIKLNLNSANSINISRLIAQICYYFEAMAQLPEIYRNNLVISVPSGNFGNLTAGLLAKSCGLPIKRFIISTNINDTVPRFIRDGIWSPKSTIPTLSNAMDVSNPNNWSRVAELFSRNNWSLNSLSYGSVNDDLTKKSILSIFTNFNYISEPHSAIAYSVLQNQLNVGEYGIFLSTAHPSKFQEIVENIIKQKISLPLQLAERLSLPILSLEIPNDFGKLRQFLLEYIH